MRKQWCVIGMMGLLLSACSTNDQVAPQSPVAQTYTGPVVEIPGVEPVYEPYNPANSQDYSVNGKSYKIIKNPQNYSEIGLASWYDSESNGTSRTANGETFDANALTAAHPTLPLPSYVRVTNVANGRQLVVRVNDRGPFKPGRIIDLSKAAGDRLNITNNSKVRLDVIQVAPDGSLSGPGTIGTVVAKQSYALPPRPDISASGTGGMQVINSADNSTAPPVMPVADSTDGGQSGADGYTDSSGTTGQPVRSIGDNNQRSGLLGAPSALPSGVIESETPAPEAAPTAAPAVRTLPASVVNGSAAASTAQPNTSGHFMVQVGALADRQRAQTWQSSLSARFGVAGKVVANGALFRVQLGPVAGRSQAQQLQQRLQDQAQQQSFIINDGH